MKCENEALWKEVLDVRVKCHQQQKTVNNLIQFMSSMIHQQKRAFNQDLPAVQIQQLQIENEVDIKRRKLDVNTNRNIYSSDTSHINAISHEGANSALQYGVYIDNNSCQLPLNPEGLFCNSDGGDSCITISNIHSCQLPPNPEGLNYISDAGESCITISNIQESSSSVEHSLNYVLELSTDITANNE